jgi:hypothetical protein
VVATDELKLPILEDNEELRPDVVVATDELNEPIELDTEELNVFVVLATLELNEPMLVDTLELNVEYSVVPVILICDEPDTNEVPEATILPVIETFEFTLNPFALTEAVTAPLAILSNCNPVTPVAGILYKLVPSPLKEPVNEPVLYEEVKEFKLLVLDCKLSNFELTEPELMDDDTKESVTSTPFNIKDPVIFALTIRIVFM